MNKKKQKTNWPRHFIQWSVILAILVIALIPGSDNNLSPDFEAYCPFGGIQALGNYLLNQALACTMTSAQIVMGIILILTVFLLSKLFCSYICPVGTVSEWLGKTGDKLKVRITVKGIADKLLRSLKYVLLFITIYFTLQSNELFCKKFDPYFSIVSGFDSDVVVIYAIIAIVLVVAGSVFIRLFWCKYICPLGAISNIFRFTGFFAGILLVYILLLKFGVAISFVWPLSVSCLGGYLIEVTGKYGKIFPLIKITRNEENCTGCRLCSNKCPQAIDPANMKVVSDADCNLCCECISACPVKNALQINKKKNLHWLPPVATIILVITGLFLGNRWELPTIDQKWYGEEVMDSAKIFTQSGLKNIKCYGSSMVFASKMKETDGVLGVSTYVRHHKVKVYYDPSKLNETKLKKLIFTPSGQLLRSLKRGVTEITKTEVWLGNFFDLYDFNYLARMLQEKTDAVYVSSEYDCPVKVTIYFPGKTEAGKEELVKILESKTFTYKVNEKSHTVKLGYKVEKGPVFTIIPRNKYICELFKPYQARFNNYERYNPAVVDVVTIPVGINSVKLNKLSYLVSHLSNNNGIIGFRTFLNDSLEESIAISYIDSMTCENDVFNLLKSDTLQFTYSSGETGKIANMFDFK